jgi:hypothetical protein
MAVKNLIAKFLPRKILNLLVSFRILKEYGYYKSVSSNISEDNEGNPLAWYTYPALEYIRQLDFSDKVIFEYGCGNSTLFWSSRAKSVHSVEHDSVWFEKVFSKLPANVDIKLVVDEELYLQEICTHDHLFDVIVIDGICRERCVENSVAKLSETGMIILDNANWYPNTAKALRDLGLIEVDMSGMGPIAWGTWTTSFFLQRGFKFNSAEPHQPRNGVASIKRILDMPSVQ